MQFPCRMVDVTRPGLLTILRLRAPGTIVRCCGFKRGKSPRRQGHRRFRQHRARYPMPLATVPRHRKKERLMKNILFVADPLDHFKIYKDTTFSMMREAQRRGHTLSACEPRHMSWQRGRPVTAKVRVITLTGDPDVWFTEGAVVERPLHEFVGTRTRCASNAW